MTDNLMQALLRKLERDAGNQSPQEIAEEMTRDPDVDAPLVEPEDIEAIIHDLGLDTEDFEY